MHIKLMSAEESRFRQTLEFQIQVLDIPMSDCAAFDETQSYIYEVEQFLKTLNMSDDDECMLSDQAEPCWTVLIHICERALTPEFLKSMVSFLKNWDPKFRISLAVAPQLTSVHIGVLEVSFGGWMAQRELAPLLIQKEVIEADGKTVSPLVAA